MISNIIKTVIRTIIWGAICGLIVFVVFPLAIEFVRMSLHVLGIKKQVFYCGFTDMTPCNLGQYFAQICFGLIFGGVIGIMQGIVVFTPIILGILMIRKGFNKLRKPNNNNNISLQDNVKDNQKAKNKQKRLLKIVRLSVEFCVGAVLFFLLFIFYILPPLKYIIDIRTHYSFLFEKERNKPNFAISFFDVIKNTPYNSIHDYEKSGEEYAVEWATKIREHAIIHKEDKKYCEQLLISSLSTVKDRNTWNDLILARSKIIDILGEIGSEDAIFALTKEAKNPQKSVMSSGSCPKDLYEQRCEHSTIDITIKALTKLGIKLNDMQVDWKEHFSQKPGEIIATIYDVILSEEQNANSIEKIIINDDNIIKGAVEALRTCKGCHFLVAPFLTHVKDNKELIKQMIDILNTSKVLSRERVNEGPLLRAIDNKRYIMEKSIAAIRNKQTICYSYELYLLSMFYSDSDGFGFNTFRYNGKDKRSEAQLMEAVKLGSKDDCIRLSMDDGYLKIR